MPACNESLNWIIKDRLAVGDRKAGTDLRHLKELGFDGIISCVPELPRSLEAYQRHNIDVLHISIHDNVRENIGAWFQRAYDFIRTHKRVFVHCAAGMSRSVSIIASYIIKRYHKPADKVLNYIRSKRPCESVNRGFRDQLQQWEHKQLN